MRVRQERERGEVDIFLLSAIIWAGFSVIVTLENIGTFLMRRPENGQEESEKERIGGCFDFEAG